MPKIRIERALALACGFDFQVGVRSASRGAGSYGPGSQGPYRRHGLVLR
ncbi:hypothetical protein [Pyxidicoccus xibeiensis]|nr:hypothetical protein [Pyxidicoccus xibeiensis]MCP3140829.1 hypothetical protein [Pyxidicoccus xibeiensis]